MNRPLMMAKRGALVGLLFESIAMLAAVTAVYELVIVIPYTDSAAQETISWCEDEIVAWDGPSIDDPGLAESSSATLPLGSHSLASRLVGLGCALLGVAGSLYGRIGASTTSGAGGRGGEKDSCRFA